MRALLATVLFVIFAFDIGFSIGGFLVTTNRFCLVILAVVLAVELFNQKKIKSWNVIISSSFPLFIALICLISFLFNYSQEGIFIILSWFLIAFVVFAYGIILDRLSKPELETIITVSPVLGLMILLVVLFIISQNMGINAVLGMPVRHWFKYHMPGGLSRFMNGLLVLTLLPFLYYLKQRKGEMKTSKLYKIGTITLFTLSVLLTIVVGSRQTLLAIFVGLSIYFALYSKTKFYNIATLGCVLLVLYLFASVLFGEAGFLWLEERFLAKTMSDIETGSERKFLYLDA